MLNEAELTLPPFLADLAAGDPQRIYASDELPDIRQTPVPGGNSPICGTTPPSTSSSSRGCPFSCDFCNITALFGHKPRTKTAAQVIAELDRLYALGWRHNVFFVDDNFIGNKQILKTDILPAIIQWRAGKAGMPFSPKSASTWPTMSRTAAA